jgi:hypothetical protein
MYGDTETKYLAKFGGDLRGEIGDFIESSYDFNKMICVVGSL